MGLFALNFRRAHHPSSLTDVPETSAEGPEAEASLHMLTLYHPCNGSSFTDVGKEYKDKSWAPIPTCGGAVQVTMGKPLKGPLSLLPHEGKMMPGAD